jgi:D-alanyl-lipoteichoic acid acyltransferase DltB (MBOAT superfamily)
MEFWHLLGWRYLVYLTFIQVIIITEKENSAHPRFKKNDRIELVWMGEKETFLVKNLTTRNK